MSKPLGTYLSIDLDALLHNYRFIKSQLLKQTKVLGVIKAFAYGHDAVAMAKKLENEKIDYFAVAYVAEGIALRKAGIATPILVLHPQLNDAEMCFKYRLEPNIYSFLLLNNFEKELTQKNCADFPIHLKFNTGLNRLGFVRNDIPELLSFIHKSNLFKVQSVFSHLAASEDHEERAFTLQQISLYKSIVSELENHIPYTFIKHICNTSGALNYPEAHFDMVRTGIGLYGYGNEEKWTKQLKNVGTLHSVISQIQTVHKGQSVGYNRAFTADKEVLSATIPLGHADGIPRTWGNGKGFVTIHGKKAPVLGNVCMDMIMVDVTKINCLEGEDVLIFDSQKTVEEISENVGSISYELLTAISQRVPRVVINE